MSESRPIPLWAGRSLALAGILLIALNLRTAVAAISPITGDISLDIPLSSVAIGGLGMLPPIAFALSGIFAPMVARRLGLDASLALASAAMVVGALVRAFAPNYLVLLVGSIIVLGGMGFGNILLPPAVKRYFPDRIGLITTAYVTLLSISTAVPSLLAAPVADSAGWRVSLGMWSVLALAALYPWAMLWIQQRKNRASSVENDAEVDVPEPTLLRELLRSRVTWAIALAFCTSTINAYATFAWLPTILVDIAGVDHIQAGNLLAVYAIAGLPTALIVPVLAARLRNVGLLIYVGIACFIAAYLGLLFAPTFSPLLWVLLAGFGPIIFPVCLVLINLRTHSHHTSIALSGFVQTFGYGLASFGPLIIGLLHTNTGGWTAPLTVLLVVSVLGIVGGVMLGRHRFVEDDIADLRA